MGGGSHITLRTALELIEEFAGRKLDVDYRSREAGDVRDTLADVSRSRDVLVFQTRMPFQDGLLAEYEWVQRRVSAGR